MAIPYRKPITKIKTEEEALKILEPYFGKKENDGYFIGAAFGPGWNDIVLDLHNKLVKEHSKYYIVQIKEKFSTLRYYTGPMTDAGRKHIWEAEELSAITCEECGRPAMLRDDNHWLVTLCDWDNRVRNINIRLWNLQKWPYGIYWKTRFAINRWRRKKGYIE